MGLCAAAAVFTSGCTSFTPVVREKHEVKTNAQGQTVTNMTQTVEYKQEYSLLGRVKNATFGSAKGMWNGMVKGYEEGTSTNGMENATFWDKTVKFSGSFFGGMGKGAVDGAETGYARQLDTDKANKEAEILKRYNEQKQSTR